MILIKEVPNILSREGRVSISVPYTPGKTIREYLDDCSFDYKGKSIVVSGVKKADLDSVITDKAEIIVVTKPHDPVSIGAAIYASVSAMVAAAWSFAVMHPFITAFFLLTAAYSIYSSVTAGRRMPSFGVSGGSALDESSPTYGWDGIQTRNDVGVPIPIIYGRHRVGGNIINQYVNNDGDKQYLNLLIALCEGEISSVGNVYINDNPVANYSGVELEYRYGTNDQLFMDGFADSHNVVSKNDQLLKDTEHVYTTVSSTVEAFELMLSLPNGVYQVDQNSGAIQSWDVTYNVQYKLHTDGAYTDLGSTTISALNRNPVRRTFRKDGLAQGQYDIKITRTSDDSSLSPNKTGDLYLNGIDEITVDEKLIYPNLALAKVKALATEQLNGTSPNATFLVDGRKVSAPRIRNWGVDVDWEDYYYDPVNDVHRLFTQRKGIVFNGSRRVAIGSKVFTGTPANFTIETLVNATSFNTSAGSSSPIVSDWAYSVGNQKGYCLRVYTSGGNSNWSFVVCNGTNYFSCGTTAIPNATFATLYANKDLHIVAKFVGGTGMYLYINNVLVASTTASIPATFTPSTGVDYIGYSTTNAGYWNGSIGFVRVYSDAKSVGDIAQLYGGVLISSGLVNWWKLDEGSGTAVEDNIGGNDGVLSSESWGDYDVPLMWDGVTYLEQFCANPVWCVKDLITNARYGLGGFITATDMSIADWVDMAKYADEKVSDGDGGYEKRFRLDIVIDSTSRALDILIQICATFRAFIFYSNGNVYLKIDREEDPVQMFGSGNIVKETFTQSWQSLKDMPNCINVQFNDETLNYKQDSIAVIDESSLNAGNPMRTKDLRIFCTRVSQALREGKYALNVAKHINRSIVLKAGIDAIVCQTGDVINVSHDLPLWGYSGRVVSGSTTVVQLDRNVTIELGKTYKLRVRFADDTQEESTVTTSPSTTNSVTVSPAFTQAPASFDLYSFGEENKVVKPFRITSLKRLPNYEVEISALEYNANVYDTDTIDLPDNNYSMLDTSIPSIENLTLTERLIRLGDGTIETVIDVWFEKPLVTSQMLNYSKARVYLSDNNGVSWHPKGDTYGTNFLISGGLIAGQAYKVAVCSVSYTGIEQAITLANQKSISLLGKTIPPSDVTTFLVNQSRDRLYFGWTAVTDIDLSGYEIRFGDSWNAGTVLITNAKGTNFISLDFKTGTGQKFFIKAIDTSGNYSANETQATVTIDSIPFTNIISSYSEQTGWAGTKSDTSAVGDNLEISTGKLSGTYETPVRDIGYVATFKVGIQPVVVDASASDAAFDDDPDAEFDDSETRRFSGDELSGAVSFEIKTSEDNITWTDYIPWQAGDYKCRYFQIRMTVTRSDTSKTIQVSELNYYSDLPDVDEFGSDSVSVAATGKAVVFSKEFHVTPVVAVSILTGNGIYAQFTAKDTTGFTVKLFDASGTAQTGDFDFHAHGV